MSNNPFLRFTLPRLAILTCINATSMAAEPVRVLILSGQNVHNWKATTPFIERMYADSKRFKVVETVEDVTKITTDTFVGCDVIVSNWTCHPVMTGGPWTPQGKKAFGDAIRSGKGLVQFHAACTACNDWEDFQEISGLTWKWQSTGHTAYYPFRVYVRDSSHPITNGMSDFWINDELYQKMAKLSKSDIHLLLEAFANSSYGGTEAWEPILITTQLGKGRGVNFLLGHDMQAMRNIAWQTIMLRCTEWAATGEVTIPIPKEWPTNASLAVATGVDIDAMLKATSEYRFGSSRKVVNLLEQVVIASVSRTDANSLQKRRELAAKLAEFLATDITAEAKSFFCKQLAMVGTPAEVEKITPLLSDERTNMMARFALERISDPAATKALREAFRTTTGKCRIGIANSLGNLAAREAVTILADALNDQDVELVAACAAALSKIGGQQATRAVKSLLDRSSGPSRQAIAEAYLACADRLLAQGDKQAAGDIFLQMYVPAESVTIQMAALGGVVAAGNNKAASLVLDALVSSDLCLARVAGRLLCEAKELDAHRLLTDLRDALKSNDAKIRERAIQAISAWPTAEALDDLLALATVKLDENQQAIVSGGIVRMIGKLQNSSPAASVKRMTKAFRLTITLEAKKNLLDQLGRTASLEALQLGLDSMKDAELAEDACAAVIRIGAALAESHKSEVIAAMQKVIAVCKSPEIVRRADATLRKAAKPVNLALGATASSPDALEPDGGSGNDQAAIDGNPATYWDETDNQKLYRFRVTFKQPTEISAINIKGHAYRSHSPKDFEILCDDKVVRTVTDAQYDPDSNEYYIAFPTTRCTSLELKITGYYGASPGIRELEVYDIKKGTGAAKHTPLPVGPPVYSWRKTGDSVALLNHDRVVWRFVYGKEAPKPFFHPLGLIDGVPLTWMCPPDHPWHRGLWFAWKELNQINYWEEDAVTHQAQGLTEVIAAEVETTDSFSTRIVLDLSYHPPGKPTVLSEKRVLQVSRPDDNGNYFVDWEGTFTAGRDDVLLKGGTAGGGYAGLSIRISPDTHDWRLIDSEGREDVPGGGPLARNMHGQRARWADFSMVDNASRQAAGLAFFEHPKTLRHPTQWHCVLEGKIPFGCFSPSPLWSEPYTLEAGESFVLSYRVLVHRERLSKEAIEAVWRVFAGQ